MSNRNLITTLIVVVVLIILGFWYFNQTGQNSQPQPEISPTVQEETSDVSTESASTQETKEFNLENQALSFTVKEMRVKKGDKVKVTFKVNQGTHDWTLDEFGAQTKTVAAGESDTVEFVADKVGSFEYYCSVPGHRQAGMKGMLIVE